MTIKNDYPSVTCGDTSPDKGRLVWEKLDRLVEDFFQGITLADLLKEA